MEEKTNDKEKQISTQMNGVVVGTKMKKTAVVLVETLKRHKLYKKQYKYSRRFKIHDEKNECRDGDKVLFAPCRPLSRDKRWRLVKILSR